MHEFSDEVQGWMYMADVHNSEKSIQKLYDYKKNNGICSEEFIYLLAQICMKNQDASRADKLIAELEESS